MTWVRLDDAMPHHPKVMMAGAQAFALDVAGIAYSNRYGTDGFIADEMLPAVLPCLTSPRRWAAKLVQARRWFEVEGGWRIHDIGDYQPTAEEQAAERAAARERMRNIRSKKARTKASGSGDVRANAQRTGGERSGDVRDPVPSRSSSSPLPPQSGGDRDNVHKLNPRAAGTNPRAQGTNPRAAGMADKRLQAARNYGQALASTLNRTEAMETIQGEYGHGTPLAEAALDAYEQIEGGVA